MPPLRALSLCLLLCLPLAVRAAEPTLQEHFDAFQKIASELLDKKSREAAASGGVQPRGNYDYYSGGQLAQLSLRWQNNQNPQEVDQSVMQVVAVAGNDTKLLKAANDLLAAMKKDREDKTAAMRAELASRLSAAGAACLAAKTPSDLDKTLADLSPYRDGQYGSSRMLDQSLWQRGSNALRFVSRWQDYLAERASPRDARYDRVQSILNELANMADPDLMPRSRILALITPAPAPDQPAPPADISALVSQTLAETKTPSDIRASISRLTKLRASNMSAQGLGEALAQLNALEDIRARIADGTVSPATFQDNNARYSQPQLLPEDRDHIARLRGAILLAAAASYLKNTGGAVLPADTLGAYIERAASASAAKGEWQDVRSALEVYRTALGSSVTPQWVSSDITSIGTYISARNQEQAGLYAQAVASYQSVLRGTGKFVPVEDISKRLAAIRQSQPAAFEEAARVQENTNAAAARALQQQRMTRPGAPDFPPAP